METKKAWEPMKLTPVGHISKVVELGGGKLSILADDPGEENRKPPGQEGG
jgi:hypothetical protein